MQHQLDFVLYKSFKTFLKVLLKLSFLEVDTYFTCDTWIPRFCTLQA